MNHDPVPCVYFFAAPVGAGLLCCGDMGREKLREGLLGPLFILSASSASVTFDNLLACRAVPAGGAFTRSALEPLLPSGGVGDVIRCGESKLVFLLCAFGGSAGTGGTSEPGELGDIAPFLRPGDGDLNVRSVMEPLLLDL